MQKNQIDRNNITCLLKAHCKKLMVKIKIIKKKPKVHK
jgi:hypothetical protein